MTASPAFALLECEGRYRSAPAADLQSVVVKFGDASLVIMTFADVPITHWPLASLARETTGKVMVLAPDPGAPERLEIDDRTMMKAIADVCADAPALRPPASRLRRVARLGGLAVLVLGLVVGAMAVAPPVLSVVGERLPQAARARLGAASVIAYAGAARCESPAARRALDALAPLLTPQGLAPLRLSIAAFGPGHPPAIAAPGGQVVLSSAALVAAQHPAALAGPVAAAIAEAAERRRTALALRRAGLVALPALLTGQVGHPRIVAAVVEDMRTRGLPSPASVAEAASLAARMPVVTGRAQRPLSAGDWRAIRTACDRPTGAIRPE